MVGAGFVPAGDIGTGIAVRAALLHIEGVAITGAPRRSVDCGNRLPGDGFYPIFTDGLKRAENFGDLGLSRHLHLPVAIPRLVL